MTDQPFPGFTPAQQEAWDQLRQRHAGKLDLLADEIAEHARHMQADLAHGAAGGVYADLIGKREQEITYRAGILEGLGAAEKIIRGHRD
jgi:hypothetical protein